jgi:hypothetical protein
VDEYVVAHLVVFSLLCVERVGGGGAPARSRLISIGAGGGRWRRFEQETVSDFSDPEGLR